MTLQGWLLILFFVGLLPYLATFRRGFDEEGTSMEVVA